jgi:glycosidase
VVTKVEPPDWVTPLRATTLRLLLTGHDLGGARVAACQPGWKTSNATASANGDYLFLDLAIPAGAQPAACPIEVITAWGKTSAPFAIAPSLAPEHRFQGFSPDDVIYLIMPDRFANGDPANDDPSVSRGMYDRSNPRYYHGGDFAGIQQRLPYLRDLGVTAIWLTPIYDNANQPNEAKQPFTDYHGYGAVDFYGVEEHFGTLDSYRALVDAAHRLGIKVIQDQVANHTGPLHPWVHDPPTPHWFNGSAGDHLNETWQTWTLLDPHATADDRRGTLEGWFANILPDLNQNDPETARYLIQNTLWWIGRTGEDAIREDTVPYAPREFWRDWTGAIHRDYPEVRVVGEVFDEDPAMVSFFQRGHTGFDGIDTGMDSVFDFPLYHAVRRVFAHHAAPTELARVIARDSLYPDPSRLVTFLGLHDVARFMKEDGAGRDELARAFSFLFAMRGAPMIYYGDEIGLSGGNDPDNRRDFPGGWPEDRRNAFDPSGRTPEENGLFNHVRALAALRKRSEALRRGELFDLISTEHVYAFARVGATDRVLVVVHEGPEPETIRIPVSAAGFTDGERLNDVIGDLPGTQVAGGMVEARLPARAVAIYGRH